MIDFPHTHFFKGGGGGQAQQIESAPVPLPAPPVTQNNAASLQAEHDYALQQQGKKSIRRTIVAGDTGGFQKPPAGPTGQMGPKI